MTMTLDERDSPMRLKKNHLKTMKCWLTRHHWLLQGEQPFTLYADNELPRDSWAYYECQHCQKIIKEHIVNLDNAPKQEVENADQ